MIKQILTLVGIGMLLAASAPAEWSTDPHENNPVDVTADSGEEVLTVSDGTGGAIILYKQVPADGDGFYDLLARKVDHYGNMVWGSPVTIFDGVANDNPMEVAAISDGVGGVFIAWIRYVSNTRVLTGQRLDSSGALTWGALGSLAVTSPTGFSMYEPQLVADGADGFIVAWQDRRDYWTTNSDIWAQRFDGSGNRLWGPGGTEVCVADQSQLGVTICSDSVGGAYVAWEDFRSTTNWEIYGQRLLPGGTVAWETDGKLLLVNSYDDHDPILVTTNYNSDFFLVHHHFDGADHQIMVGRFTSLGDWLWSEYAAENPGGPQFDPAAIADGHGGVFVAWKDYRLIGLFGGHIFLQHFSPSGVVQFGTTGTPAGLADVNQSNPRLVLDQADGVIVIWEDYRSYHSDIYGQRLTAAGSTKWGESGRPIGAGSHEDLAPSFIADGHGGLLPAWVSSRAAYYSDIYAQRVGYHGKLGHANPTVTGVTDFPQDQGGVVRLDWDRSYLDDYAYTEILDYTVWRRYGGPAKVQPVSGPELDREVTRLVEKTGLDQTLLTTKLKAGWTLLDQVEPYFRESYTYDAPTYADSTASGVVLTDFQILAHSSQFVFWESNVLAGYSVDNLAPGMPQSLMATYIDPDGLLEWSPHTVSVPDLAGYRLYRSPTPGFTPGPGNFIGSTPDTTFADVALASGAWYYKVTAEDSHDNESAPSNEAELNVVVSAVADGIPAAFRVLGAAPNPFNPSTAIRFSLARAGGTTVEVFDARGRLVKQLLDRQLSAGPHEAVWDGRDDQGRAAPSGLYLARVRSGSQQGRTKMILTK